MGALVNLTKGDFDFDIPITDIINIEETKRLMSKILVIETQDTEYRFFFTKLEEWKIAFSNVVGIRKNEDFHVLWYDPEHEVCPSKKKHT